jgi:hypothetical protein
MEVISQLHAPAALALGEIALKTHYIGGWMGPTAGPDDIVTCISD